MNGGVVLLHEYSNGHNQICARLKTGLDWYVGKTRNGLSIWKYSNSIHNNVFSMKNGRDSNSRPLVLKQPLFHWATKKFKCQILKKDLNEIFFNFFQCSNMSSANEPKKSFFCCPGNNFKIEK